MARELVGSSQRNRLVRKIQYFAINSRSARTLREKIYHATRIGEKVKSWQYARLPRDIRHGCLAVYVGAERHRFVISTMFLTHPMFKELLERSEEEFEFVYQEGITIWCEPIIFKRVLWHIGTNKSAAKTVQLDDLLTCSCR